MFFCLLVCCFFLSYRSSIFSQVIPLIFFSCFLISFKLCGPSKQKFFLIFEIHEKQTNKDKIGSDFETVDLLKLFFSQDTTNFRFYFNRTTGALGNQISQKQHLDECFRIRKRIDRFLQNHQVYFNYRQHFYVIFRENKKITYSSRIVTLTIRS